MHKKYEVRTSDKPGPAGVSVPPDWKLIEENDKIYFVEE
jgi:hypothetical protein